MQCNPGNLRGGRTHRTRNQTLTVLTQPFYYLWSSPPERDTREDLTNSPCYKTAKEKKETNNKAARELTLDLWVWGAYEASSDVHFGKECKEEPKRIPHKGKVRL